jgi:hypothetical protein
VFFLKGLWVERMIKGRHALLGFFTHFSVLRHSSVVLGGRYNTLHVNYGMSSSLYAALQYLDTCSISMVLQQSIPNADNSVGEHMDCVDNFTLIWLQ